MPWQVKHDHDGDNAHDLLTCGRAPPACNFHAHRRNADKLGPTYVHHSLNLGISAQLPERFAAFGRSETQDAGSRPLDQQSRVSHSSARRETSARRGDAIARRARAAARSRGARWVLALFLAAGAAWFVAQALHWGAIALGRASAHGGVLSAVLVAPIAAACAVPLLDACLALILRRDTPATWTRIMTEAAAALVFACLASVVGAALWPGVVVLALVCGLGVVAGLRRWHLHERPVRRLEELPLLFLLLEDRPQRRAATRPLARPLPSERQAA